jgi:hypothetical protein
VGRLAAWISGLAGGLALYGWLRRKRPASSQAVAGDPRAEELRAKLDESRALLEEQDEFARGETPVDEADPDERRRRVHEEGRSAVDRMKRQS